MQAAVVSDAALTCQFMSRSSSNFIQILKMIAYCAMVNSNPVPPWSPWSSLPGFMDTSYEDRALSELADWVLRGQHKLCKRFYFAEEFMYEVWPVNVKDTGLLAGPPADADIIVRVKDAEGSGQRLVALKHPQNQPKKSVHNKMPNFQQDDVQ